MSENTAMTAVEEQALTEVPSSATLSVWNDKAAFDQTARAASMLAQTQMIPAAYQGKPADCFVAIEIAARLNMSPLEVMRQLYVVKGRTSWSGQMCMTMIRGCGEFRNVDLEYVGKEGTDERGCYVSAERIRDGKIIDGPKVTIGMARAEGWLSNPKWKNMPELMLGYRAAAFFARLYCPEAMMGFLTNEEVEDIKPKQKSTAQRLSEALSAETPDEKTSTKSVADMLRDSI